VEGCAVRVPRRVLRRTGQRVLGADRTVVGP